MPSLRRLDSTSRIRSLLSLSLPPPPPPAGPCGCSPPGPAAATATLRASRSGARSEPHCPTLDLDLRRETLGRALGACRGMYVSMCRRVGTQAASPLRKERLGSADVWIGC